MNVNGAINVTPPVATPTATPTPTVEAKRSQLQMMLLKKALESQQSEQSIAANQTTGKGQILDIRI